MASAVDGGQGISQRKQDYSASVGPQPQPGVVVGWKLLAERYDLVARPPIHTHRHGRDTLGSILYHGDLVAVRSDQPRGCNSKPLIGIQPLVIVQRAVFHGVAG